MKVVMKKVLIHAHVYYPERWEELKQLILQIEDFDLYITVAEHLAEEKAVMQNDFPCAKIFSVPNRGYDIAPFLFVLKHADLDNYEYVLKLHTKRMVPDGEYLNRYLMSGDRWKNYLLEPFRTSEQINHLFSLFEKNTSLGCVSHYKCLVSFDKDKFFKSAFENKKNIKGFFVAGTMFLCRAFLMKKFQKLDYGFADFEVPQKNSFQLAHKLERYLGYCIYEQGYTVLPYDYDKKIKCLIRKTVNFFSKVLNYYER